MGEPPPPIRLDRVTIGLDRRVSGPLTRHAVVGTCQALEVEILQGHVAAEAVHLLLSAPPNISPSKILQRIKGERRTCRWPSFGTSGGCPGVATCGREGFLGASSGNVTYEVIEEYIGLQSQGVPKDGRRELQWTYPLDSHRRGL